MIHLILIYMINIKEMITYVYFIFYFLKYLVFIIMSPWILNKIYAKKSVCIKVFKGKSVRRGVSLEVLRRKLFEPHII